MARRWTEDGHQVTVLCGQPGYNAADQFGVQPRRQQLDGFNVVRCPLLPERRERKVVRLINAFGFAGSIVAHAVWRRDYDVIVASTMPPVVVALGARMAAALIGAKFVYHKQDIYPELAVYARLMKKGVLFRLVRWLDVRNCMNAETVVVLSEDMASTERQRGIPPGKTRIINNFELEEYGDPVELPEALKRPEGMFRVVFAGNIGRFQGLHLVIEAARELRGCSIRFEFLGEGIRRAELEAQAGDLLGESIFFHGHQPQAIARAVVAESDLALVTLEPNMFRVAFPSKTMTYLSVGTPLLAMIEEDSELARLVRDEHIGYVVAPGDQKGLVDALRAAYEAHASGRAHRDRARQVFQQKFARARALESWSALFRSFAPGTAQEQGSAP